MQHSVDRAPDGFGRVTGDSCFAAQASIALIWPTWSRTPTRVPVTADRFLTERTMSKADTCSATVFIYKFNAGGFQRTADHLARRPSRHVAACLKLADSNGPYACTLSQIGSAPIKQTTRCSALRWGGHLSLRKFRLLCLELIYMSKMIIMAIFVLFRRFGNKKQAHLPVTISVGSMVPMGISQQRGE
jgi:hypothetical protein